MWPVINLNFSILVVVFFGILTDCFLVPDGLQKVTTKLGEIHGIQNNVHFDGQSYAVNKFLGIPYAEPPVGNLRFKKPEPLRHLPSPFEAMSHGPACPQVPVNNTQMSEDCLTLNVVAPFSLGADVLRKPVMVWIHGGGFWGGSSGVYDPNILVAFADVIVVTINYRLGALGFFSTSDAESPGNYGLWDQHLAIQWVHDNIASFGGDSDNITIFGESAGSSSVIFQTLYAGNQGLFNRAIAESGTLSAWAVARNDSVYGSSIEFGKTVGCTNTSHADLMACMRLKPTTDLVKAVQKDIPSLDIRQYSWIPVYDRDFVIEEPIHMLANAKSGSKLYSFFHQVDLLIGWNSYDGLLYLPMWMSSLNITSPDNYSVTEHQLNDVFIPLLADMALTETPTPASLDAIRKVYTANQMSADERVKTLADMSTDAFLVAPSVRTANGIHVNSTASTYLYQFAARPPYRFGKLPPYLEHDTSTNHGEEITFVFGLQPLFTDFLFDDPSQVPKPSQKQIQLSKAIMTMWSNFAKSGNPNQPRNVKQFFNVEWQQYTPDKPRFLEITSDMTSDSVQSGPDYPAIDLWNNVLSRTQRAG